jgi:ABC-2 type transport system permease protein
MSPAEGSGRARLLRSELSLLFRRRRNQVLLAVLAAIPVLIAVAVKVNGGTGGGGEGGTIFASITQNGVFSALAALLAISPLFLPLGIAVVAGDAIAGEASTGTLRYLLTVPVCRTRLLAVKFAAVVVWCLCCVVVVAAVGLAIGTALFPSGEVVLLSGRAISYGAGCWRLLLVAAYVAATVIMVGALGLFVSTLTEVPLAAMAATLALTIVSEVVDQIPQLSGLHPWLATHYWQSWIDLLRDPVPSAQLVRGLLLTLGYIAVFVSLAWARFLGKDVTS